MRKYIYITIIALLAIIVGTAHTAEANPIFFPTTCQTATATTSVTYMSAGLATTTLSCDSYSSGNPRGALRMSLLTQFAATSSSILKINIEYSQDNIDWYQDGGNINFNFATTTKPFDIGQVNSYTYNYSSTTPGLGAALNATSTRIVLINTPTRYVRAVYTIPSGSTAGAVWAQLVPIKEASQ